jgi:hypothetical protein
MAVNPEGMHSQQGRETRDLANGELPHDMTQLSALIRNPCYHNTRTTSGSNPARCGIRLVLGGTMSFSTSWFWQFG